METARLNDNPIPGHTLHLAALRYRRARAFTLVEVLTVIGILVILAAIVAIAVNVVGNNASARRTRVALENAVALQVEYENAKPLATFLKTGVVDLGNTTPDPDAPYRLTATMMGMVRAVPKNKEALDKMAGNTIGTLTAPVWADNVAYVIGQLVLVGTDTYRCIQTHTSNSSANHPTSTNGPQFWASTTEPVVVPLDGWGKQLLFVGAGVTRLKVDPNGAKVWYGTNANRPDGTWNTKALVFTSPTGRPFWMSAGPDGDFQTHDDNVYSFEN